MSVQVRHNRRENWRPWIISAVDGRTIQEGTDPRIVVSAVDGIDPTMMKQGEAS